MAESLRRGVERRASSLAAQVLVVFAFATIVPLGMVLVETAHEIGQMEAEALARADSAARLAAAEVGERFNRAQSAARTVERLPSFWQEPRSRDAILHAVLDPEPAFYSLVFVPTGSDRSAAAGRQSQTTSSVSDGEGWAAADPVPPDPNGASVQGLADGSLVLPIGIPIRDASTPPRTGTLLVGLSFSRLVSTWDALPLYDASTVMLVDTRDGRVLVAARGGRRADPPPSVEDDALFEMRVRPLASPHPSHDGRTLRAWRPIPPLSWVVVVETPRSVVMGTVLETVLPRTAVCAATVAAAVAVLYLLWRRGSRRLRRLARAAMHWARGEWSYRVGLRGTDELSELGQTFDRMAEEIEAAAALIAAQEAEREVVLARRETLLRLARQLAGESSPQHLLDDLLHESVKLLEADDAGIAQWDEARQELVQTHSYLPSTSNGTVIDLERSACGKAVRTLQTVFIHDYQHEVGSLTRAGRAGTQATVAAALSQEGKLLGAISVSTFSPGRHFDAVDAENLELLAGIAASVLVGLQQARIEGVLLAVRTLEHELNNNLALTRGYAELLAASPALPEHLRESAREALSGADQASKLVEGLRRLTAIREHDWGVPGSTIDLARSRSAPDTPLDSTVEDASQARRDAA